MAYSSTLDKSKVTPLMTVSEAAQFLRVHVNTLRRWSDGGLLASYRISSRGDRRFFKDDLVRFLSEYNAYKDTP